MKIIITREKHLLFLLLCLLFKNEYEMKFILETEQQKIQNKRKKIVMAYLVCFTFFTLKYWIICPHL